MLLSIESDIAERLTFSWCHRAILQWSLLEVLVNISKQISCVVWRFLQKTWLVWLIPLLPPPPLCQKLSDCAHDAAVSPILVRWARIENLWHIPRISWDTAIACCCEMTRNFGHLPYCTLLYEFLWNIKMAFWVYWLVWHLWYLACTDLQWVSVIGVQIYVKRVYFCAVSMVWRIQVMRKSHFVELHSS